MHNVINKIRDLETHKEFLLLRSSLFPASLENYNTRFITFLHDIRTQNCFVLFYLSYIDNTLIVKSKFLFFVIFDLDFWLFEILQIEIF